MAKKVVSLSTKEPPEPVREVIVSYKYHQVHKLDKPILWVVLTGSSEDIQSGENLYAIASANRLFYDHQGRRADRINTNPRIYSTSNIHPKTGKIFKGGCEDCWDYIEKLAARNKAKLNWDRIVLYHLKQQNLEEWARAA